MTGRRTAAAVAVALGLLAGCSSSHATTLLAPTTAPTSTTVAAPSSEPATTVAPALPPAPAVSASFVSANDGFALESNGKLVATTDGGHHWRAVGALRRPGLGLTIRFIDASDGFAFASGSAVLQITHDGGATWADVSKPFATISDLAIRHGTVYAAGIARTQIVSIWSTPVEHLAWKRDPVEIPLGAGPVPYQQFVFAGDQGWMLNVDRVVGDGARLDPGTSGWTAWAPVCNGAGGPAFLAASTARDLVALCSPGVASAAIRTFIDFSHDGGNTFTRATVPSVKFGAVYPLSPSPDTAIVVVGAEVIRTTDAGATWHVVARLNPNDGGASDSGFTTTTQGFIALTYGPLLMTYDAGATWTRVALP